MTQRARDEAGNVWDVSDPSNPVLVQAAGSGGAVVTKRADPKYQYEAPQAAATLAEATARARKAAAEAPYDADMAKAARDKAVAEAQAATQKADEQRATSALATMAPNSDIHGEAYLQKYVPPQMQATVRAYARGDLGSRAGGMSASMLPIIQHAMNYDPTVSATTFPARAKMQQDLAGNQPNTLGGGLRAMEQMLFHGRDVLHNGAALNNYDSNGGTIHDYAAYVGNKIDAALHPNSPLYSAYNQSVNNYAPESQKGVAGAAGIGAERQERHDAYSPALSQASRAAALQADATMAFDRTGAVNDQYKRLMGKDIVDLLSPDARKAYDEIMSGGYDKNGKALHPAPGYVPGSVLDGGAAGGSGGGGGSSPSQGGPTPTGIEGGATKTTPIPEANAIINDAVRRGLPLNAVNASLVNAGYPPIAGDKETEHYASSLRYAKAHPDYTGSYGNVTRSEPTTLANRFFATPFGTAVGSAADAAIGGTSDELAALMGGGNLADLNARKQVAFAQNPTSAMVGQMIGTGVDMAGVGMGGRALGLGGKALAASEIGYNALAGAGQDNDSRVAGALLNGALAAGGMGLGALAAKPLGALARTQVGQKVVNIARDLADKAPGPWSPQPIAPADALTPAEQSLMTTVGKVGTDKVAAALANGSSLNAPMALADVAPSLGELAGAAARRSPAARDAADAILTPRSQGQIGRMGDAVEQNLGPIGNTLEISRALSQDARTAAAPLYDAAYTTPTPSTPELDSLLQTPFGREAIGKARTIAANERKSPTELGFALGADGSPVLNPRPNEAIANHLFARQELDAAQDAYRAAKSSPGAMDAATARLESARQGLRDTTAALDAAPDPAAVASVPTYTTNALDYAKRGMDDVLEQYRNPITGRLELSDAGKAQNLVKNQLLAEMDRVNPVYGDARQAYGGPMQSLDALHLGQDLYGSGINANQVASSMAGKSPELTAQAQLGYRDAMMTQADKLSYASNPWNILNNPAAEAKLGAMYPDSDGVASLLAQRDLERTMAGTNTRVLGGSQTAGRQIADQQFLPSAGASLAIDGATAAMGGVPVATATRALMGSRLMDGLRLGIGKQADAKAEALVPLLLNTSPDASSAIVNDLLAKQAAYDAYRRATTPTNPLSMLGGATGAATADAGYR